MTYEIDYTSDVHEAPHHETGELVEHLAYYVVVTDGRGRRWAHNHMYSTTTLSRAECETKCQRLMERVRAAQAAGRWAGPVDNQHWHRTYPVYGGRAYETEWAEWDSELLP